MVPELQPPMAPPLVSVIVPTYNCASTLERTIESLVALGSHDLEVIVADDASTDNSSTILARWSGHPQVRIVRRPRRGGPAAARNSALEVARGEILAFLDADMEAPSDWLVHLLAPIEQGEADVVGGPDKVPQDAPLVSRCIGYSMDSPLASAGLRWGTTRLVRYLPGTGNLAVRREVYERVGGFNEDFVDSGEDKEWLFRVDEASFRICYAHQALAWHHRTRSLGVFWVKMFRCGLRRVDIWRALPQAFEWPHAAPAGFVVGFLLALCWVANGWPGCSGLAGVGLVLMSLDGLLASFHLGDVRAFLLTPWTSLIVPLAYGVGIWYRLLETWWRR